MDTTRNCLNRITLEIDSAKGNSSSFFFSFASRNKLILSFQFNFTWTAANVHTQRCLDALQSRLENVRKAERKLCSALLRPEDRRDAALTGVKITGERDVRMHQMRIACTGRSWLQIAGNIGKHPGLSHAPTCSLIFLFCHFCRAIHAETAVLLNLQLSWCNFEVFAVLRSIGVIWSFANSIKRN